MANPTGFIKCQTEIPNKTQYDRKNTPIKQCLFVIDSISPNIIHVFDHYASYTNARSGSDFSKWIHDCGVLSIFADESPSVGTVFTSVSGAPTFGRVPENIDPTSPPPHSTYYKDPLEEIGSGKTLEPYSSVENIFKTDNPYLIPAQGGGPPPWIEIPLKFAISTASGTTSIPAFLTAENLINELTASSGYNKRPDGFSVVNGNTGFGMRKFVKKRVIYQRFYVEEYSTTHDFPSSGSRIEIKALPVSPGSVFKPFATAVRYAISFWGKNMKGLKFTSLNYDASQPELLNNPEEMSKSQRMQYGIQRIDQTEYDAPTISGQQMNWVATSLPTTIVNTPYPENINTIIINGSNSSKKSDYTIQVSGDARQVQGTLEGYSVSANPDDVIQKNRIAGSVYAGADGYVYSGNIEDISFQRPEELTIYINGVPKAVGQEREENLSRTLVIDSTAPETGADYQFTVSGEVQKVTGTLAGHSVSINSNDVVTGSNVSGQVAGGADGYRFKGKIENFSLTPVSGATVYVDGQETPITQIDADKNNGNGEDSDNDDTSESPIARIDGPTGQVYVSETRKFSGRSSTDPDSRITNYNWKVTQGTENVGSGNGKKFTHTFSEKGTHKVELTVIDNQGNKDVQTLSIEVKELPVK